MSQQSTYQDTAQWTIERYRPDYLALYDNWYPDGEKGLPPECAPRRQFEQPGLPGFTVYECDWTD
jgi:hypothetical protein